MKIVELLSTSVIAADLQAADKNSVLTELTDVIVNSQPDLDREEVLRVLHERERLGSTGIGDGVAIPHGKLKNIDNLLLSFGRSKKGIDFDSMDGKPAHLFFLLLAPEESVGVHLKTLARISKLLKNTSVRNALQSGGDAEDLYRIIADEEDNL